MAAVFYLPRSCPFFPSGRILGRGKGRVGVKLQAVHWPALAVPAPVPAFRSASEWRCFHEEAELGKRNLAFHSASGLLALRVRAVPGTWIPLPGPAIIRDTERLCGNNLGPECLMSQDPSSFHSTFLSIQVLPFVGVTEWGLVGRAGFLLAALGAVGPVRSSPRVAMWAALTLILRKVNYLSIIRPRSPDRRLGC